jgi:signal transduction histidine kinase
MEHRGSGLAAVTETLRSTGGTLFINSTEGNGTEMRITIDQQSAPQQPGPAPAEFRLT